MHEEKPKPNISSVEKQGVADGKADLSPDEIKQFYHQLYRLMEQAPDIFFKNAHFWPKHTTNEVGDAQNDYQLVQHRYRNVLAGSSSFCQHPDRAVYKEKLTQLRERLGDESDLENMRVTARKYMNEKQAKKDGYRIDDPLLLRKAMAWIDKVETLTGDFCTKVDAMYPPEQTQGKA